MEREYIIGRDFKPYSKDLIEEMYKKRILGMPVSFWLLDFRKTKTYCHECSNFLTMVIPGSKRVEGRKKILKGNKHSWVEKDNLVYDTTQLLMWNKDAYYERDNPYEIKVYTEEEIQERLKPYLEDDDICKETYVAWIRDLEQSLPQQPYDMYLKPHIEAFKKEANLDINDYDEQLVREYLASLNKFYNEIEDFLRQNRNQDINEEKTK